MARKVAGVSIPLVQYDELMTLARVLASYECAEPEAAGITCRQLKAAHKPTMDRAVMCGPCHAAAFLEALASGEVS